MREIYNPLLLCGQSYVGHVMTPEQLPFADERKNSMLTLSLEYSFTDTL